MDRILILMSAVDFMDAKTALYSARENAAEPGKLSFGVALENRWAAGPGYAVTIGEQNMGWVTGFSIRRQTDDEVTAIANAQWEFTMEELLGPGSVDPPDPTEPFVLTLTRDNSDETFTGCTWTSVKRTDTLRGISQIRTGKAKKRMTSGIL